MEIGSILTASIGGILIGGAASGLLLFNGRIAGISNILAGVITPGRGDTDWRWGFLLGLVAGGLLLLAFRPSAFPQQSPSPLGVLAGAGLLVGIGTRLANGCTSGHGVCGLSRRSKRSLVATLTFMTTGALTVYVARHVLAVGTP